MIVYDLSGKKHNWKLNGYTVSPTETRPRSSLHLEARHLIKEAYVAEIVLEEVHIPGEHLYLDFFLPLRKLAIEVHGEQHFKFVSHFHGSLAGFAKSKRNDKAKEMWCQVNNIKLITLPYTESLDEWRRKITS